MYKLKNTYIDKMIESKVSRKEIAFLLYLARFQDNYGVIHSVYYKDVCEKIECSIQKFYDILVSLSRKDLICYRKDCDVDIAVTLNGNDFSDQDFSSGYINVEKKDFENDKFSSMLAGSQLLFLYTQRFVEGKHMFVEKFYEEFCNMFHVARKTMQIYLQQLKERSLLFISKKRNKAYHYEMTMKRSSCLDRKGMIPHEKDGYLNNVRSLLKLNFGRFVKEGDDSAIKDISALCDSQRADKYCNFVSLIVSAIKKSISIQKTEKKKACELNAALVNKCLTGVIDEYLLNTA